MRRDNVLAPTTTTSWCMAARATASCARDQSCARDHVRERRGVSGSHALSGLEE